MAKTVRFSYHSGMNRTCRPGINALCFALSLAAGCATNQKPSQADWQEQVQQILTREQGQFQLCGKHLKEPLKQAVHVNMTFRLNPSGALETLWLNESSAWDSRFYDCLFNVVDRMNFPSFGDETSLEIQQALIFKPRS